MLVNWTLDWVYMPKALGVYWIYREITTQLMNFDSMYWLSDWYSIMALYERVTLELGRHWISRIVQMNEIFRFRRFIWYARNTYESNVLHLIFQELWNWISKRIDRIKMHRRSYIHRHSKCSSTVIEIK